MTNATLLPASSFAFGATKHCADMQQAEREREGRAGAGAGGGRRGTGLALALSDNGGNLMPAARVHLTF